MSCMYGNITNGRCSYCGRPWTPPDERRQDALPMKLRLRDRYVIGDVLGAGGFGITYAAWDMRQRDRVAVKELYPSMDLSRRPDHCTVTVVKGQEAYFAQARACFKKEAETLMQLQQDGVVRLFHYFEEYNTCYFVMEYLDGQDLRKTLQQKGTMTWAELAPMVRTLLEALERLHEKGLIHRDISPDNIFVTRDGKARLIDFGSVRVFQGNHSFTTFVKRSFSPLEQYKSHGVQGAWTDIYALCVTLYYALSGQLPPIAPERRQGAVTTPLRRLCPQLPEHVAAAITKGMSVAAEDRCQTVRELAGLLFPGERAAGVSQKLLYCQAGLKRGQAWQLRPGGEWSLGRSTGGIQYPDNAQGISRRQCRICMDAAGRVLARDEGSRYGTFCQGMRMRPGEWYLMKPGYVLMFAHEQYVIQ